MNAYISLKFFREDKSDERRPIQEIANSLPLIPDKVWELRLKPPVGVIPKEDGFSYKYKGKDEDESAEVDYAENEFVILLEKIMAIKPKIDKALGNYQVELSIALYAAGQINPGIHLNNKALALLNQFGGTLDIDIYCT
jgi:hypothetical protein